MLIFTSRVIVKAGIILLEMLFLDFLLVSFEAYREARRTTLQSYGRRGYGA